MKNSKNKIFPLLGDKLGKNLVNKLLLFKQYRVIELNKEQAFGIYAIRNRIQNETNVENYLIGYENLLKGLDAFDEDKVLVHTFLNDNELYVFFTDSKMKIIIGLLSNKTIIL